MKQTMAILVSETELEIDVGKPVWWSI